jgi:osmoprotectant transport system ATP-binding protein
VIILEHVTKRYPGGTVAVDDLGLEVPDGKIMILVGPSGYGKTTTLRMVNRLVEPTGVRILLDGHDVAQARLALRRGIGYVIQQTGLFPAPDREGQHRHGPAAERLAQGEARARARERLGAPIPAAAVRRAAAARRRGPGAGHNPSLLLMDERSARSTRSSGPRCRTT